VSNLPFKEIWACDFEFGSRPGELPEPRCLVARELRSGKTLRLWADELERLDRAPFDTGMESVMVAYYAIAELHCFLVLGWPMPVHVIDLYAEFRVQTNGVRPADAANNLLCALDHFGLDAIAATKKREMIDLVLRGGPYSEKERRDVLDYCQTDVLALCALLPKLQPGMNVPQALLRGRYTKACARMENRGVPIDVTMLDCLRGHWEDLKLELVKTDRHGLYDGTRFVAERFERLLISRGYPWERHPSGALKLDEETFRRFGNLYPEINQIRELRSTLAQLRLEQLSVGADGRNRTLISAFRARSGRNAPSNTKSIFGPSTWIRGLIKPEPGRAIAYLDWSAQEFAIAAALSGDAEMIRVYQSGDPYLGMAVIARKAPAEATKATHSSIRNIFKIVALAVQYGMQAESLAVAASISRSEARQLLRLLREKFRVFYAWADGSVNRAMLGLPLETLFGWRIQASANAKAGTFRNFPVQAAGAEMLRLACIFATEAGLPACWPVHDALLVEAAIEEIDNVVAAVASIMARVSEVVTRGLRIRVGVEVVRYPNRYMDPRGEAMWQTVTGLLRVVPETAAVWSERQQICGFLDHTPVVPVTTPDRRQC
jgi:hypothetical protein